VSAVVFLDFDGVLNSDAHLRAVQAASPERIVAWSPAVGVAMLDPVRVAHVQRICDETGASVVIVSGWRRWAPVDVLAECLAAAGLAAPVIDAVGGLRFCGETRVTATREWLAAHPDVTAWVVLDDDERLHWWWAGGAAPWWAGRIVHPVDGITDADADAAVAILRGAT